MKKWFMRIAATLGVAAMVLVPLAWAATTYTSNVCMPLPTPGDPASQNTWGALLNTGSQIIDSITSATKSISVAGSSNVVLTFNCGSVDQTDGAHFNFTGALGANVVVLWPNGRGRTFSVTNSTTGGFTLSLGANNGSALPAGATVAIPVGYTGSYYSDGTNVYTRVTSGGLIMGANSLAANIQGSTGPGADVPIPNCSGALTYATGSGFGCGTGGGGGGGGGSPALAFGGTPTTSFVAAVNTIYCVDTSGGTLNMTLPPTPTTGNEVVFMDCKGTFTANNFVVLNNGNLLMSLNENMIVATGNAGATLVFAGAPYGWRMY